MHEGIKNRPYLAPKPGDRVKINNAGLKYLIDLVREQTIPEKRLRDYLDDTGTYMEFNEEYQKPRVVWDNDHSATRNRNFWPLEYLEHE